MEEAKKVDYAFAGDELQVGVDSNQDGQKAIMLKLKLSEAVGEAFAKGEAVEGVEVVGFKFEGSKLMIEIDSDKDGEKVLVLEADLAEVADEVISATKKD